MALIVAKFDPVNRLREFIDRENSSTHFVAMLALLRGLRGLSQSRLSQALRGRSFDNERGKVLSELIAKLEKLSKSVSPIPIKFADANLINDLLTLLDQNRLVAFAVAESPTEDVPVIDAGESWERQQNSGKQ